MPQLSHSFSRKGLEFARRKLHFQQTARNNVGHYTTVLVRISNNAAAISGNNCTSERILAN